MAKKPPKREGAPAKVKGPRRGKRVRIPAVPPPVQRSEETVIETVEFCGCTNTQLERGTSCGLPQCPNMAGFPKPIGIEHPIPVGARVHHVAGIATRGRPELGGPYWGTVKEVVKPAGGAYEYDVMPDGSHSPTARPFLTVWEEHHVDEVLAAEE
jgi:hypothetical protein